MLLFIAVLLLYILIFGRVASSSYFLFNFRVDLAVHEFLHIHLKIITESAFRKKGHLFEVNILFKRMNVLLFFFDLFGTLM